MKCLFLVLLSFNLSAKTQDRYILPKDIVDARDRVIASKQKLDRDIQISYFRLCNLSAHNEAQHIEFLAYREITGLDCWQLILK